MAGKKPKSPKDFDVAKVKRYISVMFDVAREMHMTLPELFAAAKSVSSTCAAEISKRIPTGVDTFMRSAWDGKNTKHDGSYQVK